MNRSSVLQRAELSKRDSLRVGLALLAAVACALLLALLLIAPPARDMASLAVYLTISGGATVAAGWLVIRAIDHAVALSIKTKSVLTALTGTAVALLNVLLVAQLMFVSTSHDLRLLIALIAFGAIITAFFSLWLASNTAARLSNIAGSVRVLASGQFAERTAVAGRDEVAALARDVNALAVILQETETVRAALDGERRELTAAISHDLRTPLASLRAMVEALDDEVVVERPEVRRYYVTMRKEIDRLSRMIDDLFELAQIDAGALRLNIEKLCIGDVVSEVVDAMQPQALKRGISLSLDAQPVPQELPLDGSRVERALANLVRNALEHTPCGGVVTVSIRAERDWAVVRVADSGEGIAPSDLPKIWTRFFRAERSRQQHSDSSDGAGLGLAITRGIVESHGGAIEATSEPGRGTIVTIRLPTTGKSSYQLGLSAIAPAT